MKLYNLFPATFLILSNQLALAGHSIDFYCKPTAGNSCEFRIEQTLTKLGCETANSDSIDCEHNRLTDGNIRCKITGVNNCKEPSPYLFSITASGTYCSKGEKKSLYKYDKKLSLTWSMGIIRSYVKHICVN